MRPSRFNTKKFFRASSSVHPVVLAMYFAVRSRMPSDADPAPAETIRRSARRVPVPRVRHKARQSHRCRALDVIVEDKLFRPVTTEELAGQRGCEVLEVNQSLWVSEPNRLDELVDELVVVLSSRLRHRQTKVLVALAELLVIRAKVQRDREDPRRVEARAGDVEVRLPDDDACAVDAQISEPQDARPVGDDDEVHVVVWVVVDEGGHVPFVLHADVHLLVETGLEDWLRPALADEADRRRVHDAAEFLEVLHQHLVVEHAGPTLDLRKLAPVLDALVVGHTAVNVLHLANQAHHAAGLVLHVLHARRQKTTQTEALPLGSREGGALVEHRVVEQREALVEDPHRPAALVRTALRPAHRKAFVVGLDGE
jgi:hypothetical protein